MTPPSKYKAGDILHYTFKTLAVDHDRHYLILGVMLHPNADDPSYVHAEFGYHYIVMDLDTGIHEKVYCTILNGPNAELVA